MIVNEASFECGRIWYCWQFVPELFQQPEH